MKAPKQMECDQSNKEMVFPVRGETPGARRKKVDQVFAISPMAGFLLASVNLEWTLRRAILALGRDPTKQIRVSFRENHGIDSYKKMWKTQVSRPFGLTDLFNLVEKYGRSRGFLWKDVRRGFETRNVLVHGRSCTQGQLFLRRNTDIFLEAAELIVAFVKANGENVFKTIRRIKPRKCTTRT